MRFPSFMKAIAASSLAVLLTSIPAGANSPDDRDSSSGRETLTIPARAASTTTFRTLVRALVVTDLVRPLTGDGPFTVFAPTDEAFAKLGAEKLEELFKPENKQVLADVLKYHVVNGKIASDEFGHVPRPKTLAGGALTIAANSHGIAVNDATVIKADVPCSNGLIHVVDSVLMPSKGGVLDVAKKAGKFNTLLAAVKAAGLEDALSADGPFTVLAPTDEAFAKLGSKKIQSLLLPENKKTLAKVLQFHVIPNRVTAREAITAGKAKTLQGSKIKADIVDGRLVISGAKVLSTDIEAGNGLIHVIDTVLIPPGQ